MCESPPHYKYNKTCTWLSFKKNGRFCFGTEAKRGIKASRCMPMPPWFVTGFGSVSGPGGWRRVSDSPTRLQTRGAGCGMGSLWCSQSPRMQPGVSEGGSIQVFFPEWQGRRFGLVFLLKSTRRVEKYYKTFL